MNAPEPQHPTARGFGFGRFLFPITSQRTEAAANGEVNAYVSGATIVLQIYDEDAGAWRSVGLT